MQNHVTLQSLVRTKQRALQITITLQTPGLEDPDSFSGKPHGAALVARVARRRTILLMGPVCALPQKSGGRSLLRPLTGPLVRRERRDEAEAEAKVLNVH